MDIKEMTTKELKDEYKGLYQMIYVMECYGTSDIRELQAIAIELANRGVEINTTPIFN